MSHTLYATFATPEDAERAAGSLLNRGARAEDLSVVRQPHAGYTSVTEPSATASNVVVPPPAPDAASTDPVDATAARAEVANGDLGEPSTRVRSDAEAGAVKGGLIGAGLGAVAVIASMIVPGVGLILGAGALASAIGGVVTTAGAGAATGALVAYLKDAGVEDDEADEYGEAVQSGGAILAVTVPSGEVDEAAASEVLREFGATNVNRYAARGYVS